MQSTLDAIKAAEKGRSSRDSRLATIRGFSEFARDAHDGNPRPLIAAPLPRANGINLRNLSSATGGPAAVTRCGALSYRARARSRCAARDENPRKNDQSPFPGRRELARKRHRRCLRRPSVLNDRAASERNFNDKAGLLRFRIADPSALIEIGID